MCFKFSNNKYTDIYYSDGYCNGNSKATVKENRWWLIDRGVLNKTSFSAADRYLSESGLFPSISMSECSQDQTEQQDNFVQATQCNPHLSSQKISKFLLENLT
jgi:hypothetical protein